VRRFRIDVPQIANHILAHTQSRFLLGILQFEFRADCIEASAVDLNLLKVCRKFLSEFLVHVVAEFFPTISAHFRFNLAERHHQGLEILLKDLKIDFDSSIIFLLFNSLFTVFNRDFG
jgi:hypothetical protein